MLLSTSMGTQRSAAQPCSTYRKLTFSIFGIRTLPSKASAIFHLFFIRHAYLHAQLASALKSRTTGAQQTHAGRQGRPLKSRGLQALSWGGCIAGRKE